MWYNEWIPDIVKNLIKKVKRKDTEEAPDIDKKVPDIDEEASAIPWHKRLFKTSETEKPLSTTEEENFFEEKAWKKWLKITILVVTLTFIFFGMLWQFGIIKM
jgi:hypothetical protein